VLRRLYDATWGRAFAWGYDRFQRRAEEMGMRERRTRLLAHARGRCLEIGTGTGLNLERWPEVDELVLSEPDPHMASQLRRKLASVGRRAEIVEAPAERLPFPDAHFETVALTYVLCSVPEPAAALREIDRVLKPGGRMLFLEHVRSPDPKLARWQDRLHGPWYLFANGCHCNRDTLAEIEASPLEVERSERGEIPGEPPLVRPMLIGWARSV
jgi:ubiquinone/menaquinone biosynthesis C-methylase UbiE